MHSLCDLRNTASANRPQYSFEIVEVRGDESLICDPRSNRKPTEFVERKLQNALHCNRMQAMAVTVDECETDPWS